MNKKVKALIIEDQESIIQILYKKLKSLGHSYDVAKNQEEATLLLGDFSFDYVLLDLKIPVDGEDLDPDSTNGFNLLQQIREDYSKEDLPIIVMTAYETGRESAVKAMKNDANDFLGKPFKTGELEEKIKEVLQVKKSEVILCLQELPQNRKFKNFHAEIVIYPGKGDKEDPCRVGRAMLRFFYLTLNACLQGRKWVNCSTLKEELSYDDSNDPYWFCKRINYIKKWLSKKNLYQYFEFDESKGRNRIKTRILLSKEQIIIKITDYEKAKRETKT